MAIQRLRVRKATKYAKNKHFSCGTALGVAAQLSRVLQFTSKEGKVVKKNLTLLAIVFAAATILAPAPSLQAKQPEFPSLADQLKKAKAKPNSKLAKLIKDNQDFSKLKDKDADDPIVPPWLKVYWRKGHPEADYDNDKDATGGYPLVLKEALEGMMTHQEFFQDE